MRVWPARRANRVTDGCAQIAMRMRGWGCGQPDCAAGARWICRCHVRPLSSRRL